MIKEQKNTNTNKRDKLTGEPISFRNKKQRELKRQNEQKVKRKNNTNEKDTNKIPSGERRRRRRTRVSLISNCNKQ